MNDPHHSFILCFLANLTVCIVGFISSWQHRGEVRFSLEWWEYVLIALWAASFMGMMAAK